MVAKKVEQLKTVDELIKMLVKARAEFGGDKEVYLCLQTCDCGWCDDNAFIGAIHGVTEADFNALKGDEHSFEVASSNVLMLYAGEGVNVKAEYFGRIPQTVFLKA